MTEGKLIIRNVRKNIQDYMIYFLTLTVSVSMFYAFNSIQTQPALNDLDATKQLLSDQLGILLSALSVVVAATLAFLILYANPLKTQEKGIRDLYIVRNGKRENIKDFCRGNLMRGYSVTCVWAYIRAAFVTGTFHIFFTPVCNRYE